MLLERVVEMVHKAGWQVVNADMTLLAQKPKIAPYVPQMRETIAPLLGVDCSCVSVKATTTEKLGPIGREEGISAYAVVLLGR